MALCLSCSGADAQIQDSLAARLGVARSPRDPDAHRRLARQTALPGEALRELLWLRRADALDAGERLRLGTMLALRGEARLEAGDGAAMADLAQARALGRSVDSAKFSEAQLLCAVVRLRHSSRFVQERTDACMREFDPKSVFWKYRRGETLAPQEIEQIWNWLEDAGAKRLALGMAQAYADAGGLHPALLRRWQALHRWWYGNSRPLRPEAAAKLVGAQPAALEKFFLSLAASRPIATSQSESLAAQWGVPEWDAALGAVAADYRKSPDLADRRARAFADSDVYGLRQAALLSELFYRLGDSERALTWAEMVVRIAPLLPSAQQAAGLANAWSGHVARADLFFTAAAAASGDAGARWAQAAVMYRRAGQGLAAVSSSRLALALTARGWDMQILLELSQAQRDLGREVAAQSTLEALWARFAENEQAAAKAAAEAALLGENAAVAAPRTLLGPIRRGLGFGLGFLPDHSLAPLVPLL